MRRLKSSLTVLLLFALALFNCPAVATQQGAWGNAAPKPPADVEAVTAWLSRQAIPLQSLEAGRGFDDLGALRKVFRDARIVGLGEATHGSREFFQFKHRMVEFLVKEMGFTVFAMEVSYSAASDINDYVLYGKGDRDKALANQGLWAWDTVEITQLIEWMRRYNTTAPEAKKVKFVGFDIHSNEGSMSAVLSYLQRVAPERVGEVKALFQPMRPTGLGRQHFEYASYFNASEKNRIQSALDELLGFLYLNQTKFTLLTSVAEFNQAAQHARIIAQFADTYRRPQFNPTDPANSTWYARDSYMADNIERMVRAEKPETRFIVWAHNDHIGNYERGTGSYLRKAFGDAYYALGGSFNEGSFQARELVRDATIGALKEFAVEPAPAGSVEWYLARAGMRNYVIDFRHTPANAQFARWLTEAHPMRSIGLGFSLESKDDLPLVRLKSAFDGLYFIQSTTRARPNPTGDRGVWNIPTKND